MHVTDANRANVFGWLSIVFTAGAQLLLAPIIKHKIGAVGLGIWYLVFQTFIYLQLIELGWCSGIIREIAWNNTDKNSEQTAIVQSTAKRMLTITGLFFTAAGFAVLFIIPQWIEIPERFKTDFILSLALIACWGTMRYRYALPLLALKGQNKIALYNFIEMVQSIGRPVIGALMVIANYGVIGITVGYTIAEAVARWLAHRLNRIEILNKTFDFALFRRIIQFGGATTAVSISTMVIFYSSSFIVGWKLGVGSIALYQSSIALPLLIYRLAIIPFSNKLPGLVPIFKAGKINASIHSIISAHVYIIIASALILFGVGSANQLFVSIWVGQELFAGFEFTYIYAFFLILAIIRHNGFIVCQAKGRLKALAIAHAIEIPIYLFLAVRLIESKGLTGIAWALVISHLPATLISQLSFVKR